MVKLGWLYINLFSIPLLIVAVLTGSAGSMAIAYLVVTLHELAHFCAARYFRVGVSGFVIMPFGVCLRLKENHIKDPVQESVICAAGPACNLLLIVAAILLRPYLPCPPDGYAFFLYSNFSILLINIVPIIPLDGGRILRALLTHRYGFIKAVRITEVVSQINIALVGLLGIYILYLTHFNVSMMMLCAFLLFNMSAEKKNSELIVMQQIIYSKEKLTKRQIMPVKELAVMEQTDARRLLKNFSYNSYYLLSVLDKNLTILGTLSETQVIEAVIRAGKTISAGQILSSRHRR
ncbi:MAG TPA: site-2 protease family protein [Candidatus Aphodoplasma excrementigallinarum]|mgnify:FL=1|uniref:Site-2 protease family protein n=1 Tax=Candidatus Aphodoplasma excrementigallinarum TaxID=2840673 RepID=A0A9D1SZC1_9FIRM|nr:site-2 protease family protein [Candidatus Aphodoplasma excrementigallinarum]